MKALGRRPMNNKCYLDFIFSGSLPLGFQEKERDLAKTELDITKLSELY